MNPKTRILDLLTIHGRVSRAGIAWYGMLSNHALKALDDLVRAGRITKERITTELPCGHAGATRKHSQTVYRLSMVELWRRELIRLDRHIADANRFNHAAAASKAKQDEIEKRAISAEPGWHMVQGKDGRWGWKGPRRPSKHPATPDGTVGPDMSSG